MTSNWLFIAMAQISEFSLSLAIFGISFPNPSLSMYCMYLIGKGIDMKDIRITPKKTCSHFETQDKFFRPYSDKMGTTTKTGSSFGTLILVYSIQEMGTIWVSIIKISYTFSPKSKTLSKKMPGCQK